MTTFATIPHSTQSSPAGGTWTITTASGYTATGYLPSWADEDPSDTGISLVRLPVALADISHCAPFDGQQMMVWNPASPGDTDRAEEAWVLRGSIDCHPYAEAPEPRVPVANIAIVDDYWISNLDPDGLAQVARQLQAQADYLDNEIRPRLIAARADWAEHHGDA